MIASFVSGIGAAINNIATTLSAGDASMKGVISIMIIGSLGAIVTFGRKIPFQVFRLFLSRITVSAEFTNNWYGENRELFGTAGDFVARHQTKKLFKVFEARVSNKDLSVGFGVSVSSGIFLYKGRPVWYQLENAQEQGAVPESITIRTLGRDPSIILDMIEAQEKIMKQYTRRNFYTFDKDWKKVTAIPQRDLRLFLRPEVKEALDKRLDFFINHKKWFEERSINYKLLIILDGPPGTGKSAISRYVADRLGWSLGTISTPVGFEDAVRKAADDDIVVSVPDVDAIGLGQARDGVADTKKASEKPGKTDEVKLGDKPVTDASTAEIADPTEALAKAMRHDSEKVAGILNLFQGDLPLNNSVVVMSTNCIDKLDKALLRPSRCDLSLYIGDLGIQQVRDFRGYYYPDAETSLPEELASIDIRACNLMESFQNNAFDVQKFDEAIVKHHSATDIVEA